MLDRRRVLRYTSLAKERAQNLRQNSVRKDVRPALRVIEHWIEEQEAGEELS